MSGDQKIKTAAAKPPLGLVPAQALVGPARVFGYGAKKYAAGNFWQATLGDGAGQRYVSAALRHLAEMQLPNGLHTPEALAALDPESGLPHLDHVLCGLMMLRSIMVKCGALPADPGEGKEPPVAGEVQNVGCAGDDPTSCTGFSRGCRCGECVAFRMQSLGPLRSPERSLGELAREVAEEFETAELEARPSFAAPWLGEYPKGVNL